MDTDEIVRQSSRAEDKCWRPPSVDLVKINFDGAVFVKKIVNLIICLNILVRKKYCLNVLFTMNNLTKNIHKMHYLKHISV